MVMLCFVLDLRSLSPPLLRDLKQSLLQLGNFYAISTSIGDRPRSKLLHDLIGLCFIAKNRISSADELKVAYRPRENFSLRDFHHAVNNMPTDAFLPEFNASGAPYCGADLKLLSILGNKKLYTWGDPQTGVSKKVIMIGSCLTENLDSVTERALTDAAEKCVLVEFILFEQKWIHLGNNLSENINNFVKQICHLENCSFQALLPDTKVLGGLVKKWLQELKDDMEGPLQARFTFKSDLIGSLSHISCTLCASFNHIVDGFTPCQTCRCHGFPLNGMNAKKMSRSSSCPVTGDDLGNYGFIDNSVKVGEQTILYMPSFQTCEKLQKVSSPIEFNVIERTYLGSLSEGFILGTSYVVTPSNCHEPEDTEKSDINSQLFQALCSLLHSFDQALVCSSNCNVDTVMETSFQCYYILLPSERGPMLLRRLAGSEEVFPVPDLSHLAHSTVAKEIESSVRACLLKMDASDYNPLFHERGFHQKLNLLVKESLQFGSLPLKPKELISELNSKLQDSLEEVVPSMQTTDNITVEKQILEFGTEVNEDNSVDVIMIDEPMPDSGLEIEEDRTTARIAEEWEQLIVTEVPKRFSPTCISKPKLDQLVLSPSESSRRLDEKTSRILERLEVPRQLKTKKTSPAAITDACLLTKMPLVPLKPVNASDQGPIGSQPMKPSFQRQKRKQR